MTKKWNEKVEKIFDQPIQLHEYEEIKKAYQLVFNNQPLENISYVFSAGVKKSEVSTLFTQLSSFFEIGFLLEGAAGPKNIYGVTQAFAYSKHLNQVDRLKTVRLPNSDIYQVLKTDAHAFLNKFSIAALDSDKKLTAFLIRLTSSQSLVVMSSLAEPWLQLRIESLQKTLMRVHFEG